MTTQSAGMTSLIITSRTGLQQDVGPTLAGCAGHVAYSWTVPTSMWGTARIVAVSGGVPGDRETGRPGDRDITIKKRGVERNGQMTQLVSQSLASGVVALTLLTGSGSASAQGMALQPIVARMLTAMSAATAYRIVVDSTISGSGTPRGSVTRTHLEMIRVHHGTTTQLYMLMVNTPAKGAVSTSETVMSGTRGCTRQSRTGAWTCHYPPSAFAALTNVDPA